MDGFAWAAFIFYLMASVGDFATGLVYLLRSKFMPYHQQAVGQNWDQLDKRVQTLIIALMKSVGGTIIGASVSVMIMLIIPFRSGESWAHYAIPAVLVITFLPVLYAAALVRKRTQASTPVGPIACRIAGVIAGFVLSLFSGRFNL